MSINKLLIALASLHYIIGERSEPPIWPSGSWTERSALSVYTSGMLSIVGELSEPTCVVYACACAVAYSANVVLVSVTIAHMHSRQASKLQSLRGP